MSIFSWKKPGSRGVAGSGCWSQRCKDAEQSWPNSLHSRPPDRFPDDLPGGLLHFLRLYIPMSKKRDHGIFASASGVCDPPEWNFLEHLPPGKWKQRGVQPCAQTTTCSPGPASGHSGQVGAGSWRDQGGLRCGKAEWLLILQWGDLHVPWGCVSEPKLYCCGITLVSHWKECCYLWGKPWGKRNFLRETPPLPPSSPLVKTHLSQLQRPNYKALLFYHGGCHKLKGGYD